MWMFLRKEGTGLRETSMGHFTLQNRFASLPAADYFSSILSFIFIFSDMKRPCEEVKKGISC